MRDLKLAVSNTKPAGAHPEERRRNLRISAPFPVLVRGISEDGERVQFQAEMDNLSTGGLFLRTDRDIRTWKRLTVVMRLAMHDSEEAPAPVIAARGEILRAETRPAAGKGYAVALKSRRFI